MHDFDTINRFISLRSAGFTYDEITERIGISKPTLVKWNRLYDDEIEKVKRYLFSKLFTLGLLETKTEIILQTDILIKYSEEEYEDFIEPKDASRALAYLEKKFLNEIKQISFDLTKYGRIKHVTYKFYDED